LNIQDFAFIPLSEKNDLNGFDCDDHDINEFLKNDAIHYSREKLASSYLFINESDEVVAFFSLSNDCLKDLGDNKGYDNSIWNKLHRKTTLPNPKRIRQYPAIKIGRLGIDKKLQRTGLASQLLDFLKVWLLEGNKPAFRFLILDAYNKERQIKYYQRNGFDFLLNKDEKEVTRIMYFDMMQFAN